MVKKLHKAGIEVMLDVVFNHTAEGNENGPYISYRGIDNKTYYLLTPEGYYYNFSGCGNTMNCNNAVVRSFILDCLRYWVAHYHIDGFTLYDLVSYNEKHNLANGEDNRDGCDGNDSWNCGTAELMPRSLMLLIAQ